jgi:hypothetical protein
MTTLTSPTTPPRATERLLEALGADAEFRDALLGDLAEEHAIRAAYDGERAARRWYRREALRVAPHLLRDGARRLGWRGVGRLAGIVLTSYVFTTLICLAVAATAWGVAALLGYGPDRLPIATHTLPGAGLLTLVLVVSAAVPVLGGYIAAALDDRTPLVAALALGTAWSGVFLGVLALATVLHLPEPAVPAWVRVCQLALVLSGAALGGALRVHRTRAPGRTTLHASAGE